MINDRSRALLNDVLSIYIIYLRPNLVAKYSLTGPLFSVLYIITSNILTQQNLTFQPPMSSPPWPLPQAASPLTMLPSPASFPLPLLPPLPQIAPSSPTITPPTLPPIHNSVPPVSSPSQPPLTSPPTQLPPLPVPLPPPTLTPPPPPLLTSRPPPLSVPTSPPLPSPPPTPLLSRPSLPPPPQPASSSSPPPPPLSLPEPPPPLSLPAPPPPQHVSPPPPTTPSTTPPPPALLTPPMPPATTTQAPPLVSPSHDSPPPILLPTTPPLAPTLSNTLQPPSSDNNITISSSLPPPTTLPMPPQLMLHPPLSSSLPTTLQVHNPRPNNGTALIAGSCVIGGLVAIVLLLTILFLGYKRRRSKNKSALLEDHHKTTPFGPKDDCYAVPSPGVHVIKVLSRNSIPQSPMSRTNCSASIKSRSEIPFPPQTQRPAGSPFDISNGIFSYDHLAVATNGFSEANLLGQGGFGYVHKGLLPSGKEVAVKQLKTGSRQGEREFQAEVDIVSRVHHKHLVSLVGYCITGAERLLVYEFISNNTLEFHLHGEGQPVLEWEIRLKVATGSAKGLAYLHEDCNPKIIHRDIKASNILLDCNFEAKVSDFGLAKSFSDTNTHMTHFSTRVVGTFGYLAPEYASSGKVTEKSDVYSYGVVLLELITGRPPISTIESIRNEGLVQWARPLLNQALEDGDFDALVDPGLERNYSSNEMAKMVTCAAACVRHSAWLRPRMSQVVHALEGVASLTDLREGITPGNRTLHNSLGDSYYNSQQHKEEYGISIYIETTSEYGLNPSGSSSEARQTFSS